MTMKIVIDASNIKAGGGVSHLVEVLNCLKSSPNNLEKIYVFAPNATLDLIDSKEFILKMSPSAINGSGIYRFLWQSFILSRIAKRLSCDVLFCPGGSYLGSFRPFVTMSRNLLPFSYREIKRYGFSFAAVKIIILRVVQGLSMKKASGVIFLNEFAKNAVMDKIGTLNNFTIIPHGLNKRFFVNPSFGVISDKPEKSEEFRICYVSSIEPYKHQWNLIEAISILRSEYKFNIKLDFAGPISKSAEKKFHSSLNRYDPFQQWITYHGPLRFSEIHNIYRKSDLGVFLSTCENMPNIVLEMLASGLPIISSHYGPMPEILLDSALYVDPLDVTDIVDNLLPVINDENMREVLAEKGCKTAKKFSWKECSSKSFKYLLSFVD